MSVSRETKNFILRIVYYFFEQWIHLPNTNYFVSNKGRVFNLKTNKFVKLRPKGEGRRNYLYFRAYNKKTKKSKNYYIHKTVLELFSPTQNKTLEVMHIKPNRFDNRYPENLKWGTRKENMKELNKRIKST